MLKTNNTKVHLRDIFPKERFNEMNYTSEYINISEFKNKIYEDPFFGNPVINSEVKYMRIYGDWDMETFTEENDQFTLRLINNKQTFAQRIELVFPSASDMVTFVNEMYSNQPVKQIGTGMNLEDLKYVESPKTSTYEKISVALGSIGLGFLIYKILNILGKKNDTR